MNVLSLFDGMSCGQIALNKLGIDYDKYFACEIDKYAMQVTQHNFPDTVQLGDVQFVTKETFGNHKIDLVVGGSPCQGFSFAGKMLNFDDPRSKLFFEYVRLVKELKPKYFLLENVKMKKESQDIISKYMGVEPIEINSSLVSAQTRKRLYWTNIPNVSQPEDKGVVLRDIIESGYIDDRMVNEGKSHCLTARYSGAVWWNSIERRQRTMVSLEQVDDKVELNENQQNKIEKINNVNPDKANCLTEAIGRGGSSAEYLTSVKKKTDAVEQVDDKLRHPEATKKGYAEAGEGEGLDLTFPKSKTRRGRAMKDKSNCLTAAGHEMGVVIDPSKPNQINPDKSAKSKSEDEKGTQPHMQDRVFHEDGKSHALTSSFASRTKVGTICDMVASQGKEPIKEDIDKGSCLLARDYKGFGNQAQTGVGLIDGDKKLSWRKLTPLECERLQTVPDGYTLVMEDGKQKVSNSQRYKMLGNGWTVDVITHILKNMEL
jgi:DNA-cytosine methyltransferase